MNEEHKAYLAGMIDGEGCIMICKHRGRHNAMKVTVTNSDPRIMVWLKERLGGRVQEAKHKKRKMKKRIWIWELTTVPAAEMLRQILPYLIIKRDQAEIAIAYVELKKDCHAMGSHRKIPIEELEWRESLYSKLRELKTVQPPAQTERGDIRLIGVDDATVESAQKCAEVPEMSTRQASFGFLN